MQETELPSRSKMILVIEDSPTQALTLRSLLIHAGLKVICATNGNDGVRLAGQVNPGLILLDIQMPDINGFEVCDQLKNDPETANIPIIMFTQNDTPESLQEGMRRGAVDYIPKDAFAPAVLLETLRQMGFIKSTKDLLSHDED